MNRTEAKSIITETVINSVISFAKAKANKKSNFQILDLLIPKERKIRSIVGGLETSLGTTLWEPLARALASKNGFKVIRKKLQSPVNIPANLANALNSILADRKGTSSIYDANSSHNEIKRVCQSFINSPITGFENAPKGYGVDIWLKKDNIDYIFDTKTVQPNVGGYTKLMEQVLTWYAYYYSKNPTGNVVARIIFPYNPYQNYSFWEKTVGKGFPLEPQEEAWVQDEFWDFCSGLDGTFSLIEESFIEIREKKILHKELNNLLH